MGKLGDETGVPIKWVYGLLAGCAVFTGTVASVGMYFGKGEANAASLSTRVDKLEDAVKRIPEMAEGIARLEGAIGTKAK